MLVDKFLNLFNLLNSFCLKMFVSLYVKLVSLFESSKNPNYYGYLKNYKNNFFVWVHKDLKQINYNTFVENPYCY